MSKIERIDLTALSVVAEEPEEISIDISQYLVDQTKQLNEPIPILSYEYEGEIIPMITEDNISLIKGKAKSRKSTLIKAIGATVVSQMPYAKGGILTSTYARNEMAIVDTEQGEFHCWRAARSISYVAGKKINYYQTAGLNAEMKKYLVEEHLKQNPNCGLMIIDNIVHFLSDFNSALESSALNEWVIRIKNDYKCHLMLVLHENGGEGGNGKAKGHLGSLLENTCETVIRVEKDRVDPKRSIVSPSLTRNKEFGKFTITMDDRWIPILEHYDESDITNYPKEKIKY